MPTYPVSVVDGRKPVRSQEFKPGVHLGIDIMFRRLPTDPPYDPSDPRGSLRFFVPSGAMALATQRGRVVYAKSAANGYRVRLATPDGYEELHLHLASLLVTAGQDVEEGQPLGPVGGDPSAADPRHLLHLHYERRLNNVPEDPEPYLSGSRPSSLSMPSSAALVALAVGALLVIT